MRNKNQIYTPSYVLRELKTMLKVAKEDKELIFIGYLYKDKRYSLDTFNTVVNRFRDKIDNKKIKPEDSDYIKIEDIASLKKKIWEVIEQNILKQVVLKKLNPVFAMFLLKANPHSKLKARWIEAQHIKQELSGNITVVMNNKAKTKGTQ